MLTLEFSDNNSNKKKNIMRTNHNTDNSNSRSHIIIVIISSHSNNDRNISSNRNSNNQEPGGVLNVEKEIAFRDFSGLLSEWKERLAWNFKLCNDDRLLDDADWLWEFFVTLIGVEQSFWVMLIGYGQLFCYSCGLCISSGFRRCALLGKSFSGSLDVKAWNHTSALATKIL